MNSQIYREFIRSDSNNSARPLYISDLQIKMSVDPKTVQIMIFIFRALDEGWTVRKKNVDKYEFKKPLKDITEEVSSDDFTTNFLRRFSSIDNFFQYLKSGRDIDQS